MIFLLGAGCARQPTSRVSEQTAGHDSNDRRLPFDQGSRASGIAPSASLVPGPEVVPAGTPLTIRLQISVSSRTATAGESFSAILDQPIIVQGKDLVHRGTSISGTIVAVKRYASAHAPAYLRLKLTQIIREGKAIPIESSSVFAKAGVPRGDGSAGEQSSGSGASATRRFAHFSADHPLTFRLTAAVDLQR